MLARSSIDHGGIGLAELVLWAVLAGAVVLGHLRVSDGPLLQNDSYVYLSAADNFLAGRPGYTSIVHFDAERGFGRIPAPLTTFPSGYPAAIALLAPTAPSLSLAALAVSVAASVLSAIVFAMCARALALGAPLTRLLLVLLLGNCWFAVFGTSVTAESLYTLASLTAMYLFVLGLHQEAGSRGQTAAFAAAALVLGMSYWVRYAGLFLLTGAAGYFLVRLSVIRDRSSRNALAWLGVSAAIVGAGLLRNHLLMGSWKGGNTKLVHHPLTQVLREFLVWLHHLLLGGIADARFGLLELALCASLLLAALLSARAARASAVRALGSAAGGERGWLALAITPTGLLSTYVAVYCAGMIYLGVTSVISFDTRMFYPLLPFLLLLIGSAARPALASNPALRHGLWAALAVATISYLGINARSYLQQRPPAPHEIVARELEQPVAPGVTLRSWLTARLPGGATIVADRGQAVGYVLHRNVLSLISQEYSSQHWDEDAVLAVMRVYGAHHLILFEDNSRDPVLAESPFLSALLQGDPASPLTLEVRTPNVAVFHLP